MSQQKTNLSTLPPDRVAAKRVEALIARGESKSAVDLAKQIHKHAPSAASENLLIEAYHARIQAMLDKKMGEEADALIKLVRDKYPASRPRLLEIGGKIALSRGRLDDLVRPLLDPDLPREHRAVIEETIKQEVVDLQSLAGCTVLPADHSLRRGAAAIAAALEAVTRGPVDDAAVELPEISRRSPLASWKTLVRAIAAFYRRDDDACRRFLAALEPGSIPARLVPALEAILSGKPAPDLGESASRLLDQIDGGGADLDEALTRLENCFHQSDTRKTLKQIPVAVDLCRRAAPDLVYQLRVRIAVRSAALNVPDKAVQTALGGTLRQDAEYYRLFAATTEKYHDPELLSVVIDAWMEFRRLAIQDGRFAANSPAEAMLFLHMAEILASYPATDLELGREMYEEEFDDKSYHLRKGALPPTEFSPQALFARSCAIDPHGETYAAWLEWARKQQNAKATKEVAAAWHGAVPDDLRPLLFLATTPQSRGASRQALDWLAKAERLDALNPEVHRTKLRLVIAAAIRHLRQKKSHLLEADVAALESLPLCREGDRPAFLEALRWSGLLLLGKESEAAAVRDRVAAQLGAVAAYTLLSALAARGELPARFSENQLPLPATQKEDRVLAGDVARACVLGAGVGLILEIPRRWEPQLIRELSGRQDARAPLAAGALYDLAAAAMYLGGPVRELAYAATVAGIDGDGDFLHRFLLLRVRILPQWEEERRVHAIAAALELARRRRDLPSIEAGLELKPTLSLAGQDLLEDMGKSLSSEQVQRIVDQERGHRAFPTQRRPWPPPRRRRVADVNAECDCPACRAERQGTGRGGRAGKQAPAPDFQEIDVFEMIKELVRQEAKQKEAAVERRKSGAGKKKKAATDALDRQKNLFDLFK